MGVYRTEGLVLNVRGGLCGIDRVVEEFACYGVFCTGSAGFVCAGRVSRLLREASERRSVVEMETNT